MAAAAQSETQMRYNYISCLHVSGSAAKGARLPLQTKGIARPGLVAGMYTHSLMARISPIVCGSPGRNGIQAPAPRLVTLQAFDESCTRQGWRRSCAAPRPPLPPPQADPLPLCCLLGWASSDHLGKARPDSLGNTAQATYGAGSTNEAATHLTRHHAPGGTVTGMHASSRP